MPAPEVLLLIDTCTNEGSGVALAVGNAVVAEASLPERAASAGLLDAIKAVLRSAGRTLAQVQAVGVVSGPGSFTGIRVGLAAAKGLCVALDVPLAAVSRLEVLYDAAAIDDGWAAMDAGRGEVYARSLNENAREELLSLEELCSRTNGRPLVVDSAALAAKLGGCEVRVCPLRAASALGAVQRMLSRGASDVASTDANYVRGESQIYASKSNVAR